MSEVSNVLRLPEIELVDEKLGDVNFWVECLGEGVVEWMALCPAESLQDAIGQIEYLKQWDREAGLKYEYRVWDVMADNHHAPMIKECC